MKDTVDIFAILHERAEQRAAEITRERHAREMRRIQISADSDG